MELQDFVNVVKDYEENCRRYAEEAFWEARSKLGENFLADPFTQSMVTPLHEFLSLWRSYRHPVDWAELERAWTPAFQNTASLLANVRLESADDSALAKADELYLYLWSAHIGGLGHTNISKLLALSLPDICVIWDSGVKQEFLRSYPRRPTTPRLPQTRGDYYRFLQHRQRVAQDLIRQVIHRQGGNIAAAAFWLRQLPVTIVSGGREKPLAKLLDEYYYGRPRRT